MQPRFLLLRRITGLEAIKELLPGANCGACGFPGCNALAEAIAKEKLISVPAQWVQGCPKRWPKLWEPVWIWKPLRK